jgi:UDP-glucose 4-epimerase
MNILLTGNKGKIGSYLHSILCERKHVVIGYDIIDGKDLLNIDDLENCFNEIDYVIHMATGISHNDKHHSEIMDVNLQGLWNLLSLSSKYHVKKVIVLSSVDAIGIFKGEASPQYLPIDNNHPCYPSTAYGISKRLSEEMCQLWSRGEAIPTICLRPPGVWFENTYNEIIKARKNDPDYEWNPYWEYGAFIDVRDLCELIMKIMENNKIIGFHNYLVSSEDITTSGLTSKELSSKIHPNVKWVGDVEYDDNPYKTLLDIEPVKEDFEWKPEYSWKKYCIEKK